MTKILVVIAHPHAQFARPSVRKVEALDVLAAWRECPALVTCGAERYLLGKNLPLVPDAPVAPVPSAHQHASRSSRRWAAPAFAGSSATIASPAIATDLRETPIHLPSTPVRSREIPIHTRATAADVQEIAINIHANPTDIREIASARSEFAPDIRAIAADTREITPDRRAIATHSPRATANSPEMITDNRAAALSRRGWAVGGSASHREARLSRITSVPFSLPVAVCRHSHPPSRSSTLS